MGLFYGMPHFSWGPYIYDVHTEGACHVFADIVYFCGWWEWGGGSRSFSVDVINA